MASSAVTSVGVSVYSGCATTSGVLSLGAMPSMSFTYATAFSTTVSVCSVSMTVPFDAFDTNGKATRRRPLFVRVIALFVGGALHGVLGVAYRAVRSTLRLVHLSFCLHPFVAHDLAGGILDRALGFVSRALHVFLIHVALLRMITIAVNAWRASRFQIVK